MKSLQTWFALVLVAVWPLATSHCNLEQLPGFEFLSCAIESDATHAETDCEADGCASIESGFYKTEDNQHTVPTPPLLPSELLTTLLPAPPAPATVSKVIFDATPLELSRLWQFSLRTALPPRAPSFVS